MHLPGADVYQWVRYTVTGSSTLQENTCTVHPPSADHFFLLII